MEFTGFISHPVNLIADEANIFAPKSSGDLRSVSKQTMRTNHLEVALTLHAAVGDRRH